MKRMAIFVEGQTEQLFLEKLILHIAKRSLPRFELQIKSSGNYRTIRLDAAAHDTTHFILICNCGADNQVKTSVADQSVPLATSGYRVILGLRDVYPEASKNLRKLKSHMSTGLPKVQAKVKILLAIREVEAWFIQEGTHFLRINRKLTRAKIRSAMHFDYALDPAEKIQHPADFLDRAYRIAGHKYNKRRATVMRTLSAINFNRFVTRVRTQAPSAGDLLEPIEHFLI